MSEMFSKMIITFVAVVSALVLLLSIALPTIGSSNSVSTQGPVNYYNDTSGANASSSATNDTTATTSSLNSTNNTAMPSESDWENLTTFELFELYPVLDNLTSGASNDTSAAANETGTGQQLPSQELNQQQNETQATATANTTLSDATQQNSIAAATMPPDLLNQLQSTISSINQSITELKRNMTNTTTISVDQVVVNEPVASSSTSSQDNDLGDSNQASPVFTFSKEITDDLKKDDYIILAHLAPYSTTKGHAEVELKVPCNNDEEPQVKLVAGSIPRLREVDLGKAIEIANVRGSDDEVKLSKAGEYCLYQAKLPAGITDVILVNDSGHKLKFSEDGRFYMAMTVGLDSTKGE